MTLSLTIIVGSTLSGTLEFYDDNDVAESLAGATAATFKVSTAMKGGTTVLERKVRDGNLSITTSPGKLIFTLTQEESDDLLPGAYVGEAAVQFPAGWYHTQMFRVDVKASVASHT